MCDETKRNETKREGAEKICSGGRRPSSSNGTRWEGDGGAHTQPAAAPARVAVLGCATRGQRGFWRREVEVDDAWGRFRLRGSGARVAVGGGAGRFGADRFCQVLIRWKFEFGCGRDTVMWSVLQAYMVFCYETENGKGNGHCAFLSILSSLKIAIPAYVDIRGNGLRSVITGFHYLSFC